MSLYIYRSSQVRSPISAGHTFTQLNLDTIIRLLLTPEASPLTDDASAPVLRVLCLQHRVLLKQCLSEPLDRVCVSVEDEEVVEVEEHGMEDPVEPAHLFLWHLGVRWVEGGPVGLEEQIVHEVWRDACGMCQPSEEDHAVLLVDALFQWFRRQELRGEADRRKTGCQR